VMFRLSPELSVVEFVEGLRRAGVKIGFRDGGPFRAVTHGMVSSSDIDEAVSRIDAVCDGLRQAGKQPLRGSSI
jgi:hypothetical protein